MSLSIPKNLKWDRRFLCAAALFLVSVLSVALCVAVFTGLGKINSELGDIAAAVALQDSGDTVFDGAIFVVRESNGKVAVFGYPDGKLIEELDVYTYSLPQTDRTYLANGIMIYSVNELVSLIEDYTG